MNLEILREGGKGKRNSKYQNNLSYENIVQGRLKYNWEGKLRKFVYCSCNL